MRDLERARDDAQDAERTARHQLGKFLLRQGRRDDGGHAGRLRHWRWIEDQKFSQAAHQQVLLDYIRTAQRATERVRLFDLQIAALVQPWCLAALVRDLQAFYGISLAHPYQGVSSKPKRQCVYACQIPFQVVTARGQHRTRLALTHRGLARH
jgi:hypothetical protein